MCVCFAQATYGQVINTLSSNVCVCCEKHNDRLTIQFLWLRCHIYSRYTQAGGDSLLCFAGTSCTGPEPNWIVDTSDSNSGYPDCQAVVPDYDVYNTFNQQGKSPVTTQCSSL